MVYIVVVIAFGVILYHIDLIVFIVLILNPLHEDSFIHIRPLDPPPIRGAVPEKVELRELGVAFETWRTFDLNIKRLSDSMALLASIKLVNWIYPHVSITSEPRIRP